MPDRCQHSIAGARDTPAVTVLIAAAGEDGRSARDALSDDGFDVERVSTLAAARVRAATVEVVVVGGLEDGSARELRAAVRSPADGGPPLVHLGEDEAFETCVPLPAREGDLAVAVRLAREAGAYRAEVDALYEQCRARATGDADDPETEVERAKRRAGRALRDARRVAGRTPYEQLFAGGDEGAHREEAGARREDADAGPEGEVGPMDEAPGPDDGRDSGETSDPED